MNDHAPDSSYRILVIDDNPAIHEDFRKILCGDRGASRIDAAEARLFGKSSNEVIQSRFQIDSAYQGEAGLARVYHAIQEGFPYALAFVDVRMPPGWDGLEVTPRLWIADPNLQIVICTAYTDYTWEEMFSRIGTSDRMLILKKPFERMEVLQIAHNLTAKRRLQQRTRLKGPDDTDHAQAELLRTSVGLQTEIFRLKQDSHETEFRSKSP